MNKKLEISAEVWLIKEEGAWVLKAAESHLPLDPKVWACGILQPYAAGYAYSMGFYVSQCAAQTTTQTCNMHNARCNEHRV